MRNTLTDEKLKDKFSVEEKVKLTELIEATQKWIDSNQNAETEEYKNKLKSLEEVFHPIMQKVYAQTGGMPGGMPGAGGFPGGFPGAEGGFPGP